LRGEVETTEPQLAILLRTADGKKTYTANDRRFVFANLPAGRYTLTIIADRDGNGRWTPGSVSPLRLAEPVLHAPDVIQLKPNWELEGVKIRFAP